MEFKVGDKTYVNERAIATQQTGFWFVAQARGWLPDEVGALMWFGCDDAATSYLIPIYANINDVPECVRVGNGDLLHYSPTSQFWMCNRVTNSCYRMYNQMAPYVRKVADEMENRLMAEVLTVDKEAEKALKKGGNGLAATMLTRYTLETAQKSFERWAGLDEHLLVKFIDGNVKPEDGDGNFLHSQYNEGVPDKITQPGYTDLWKETVAREHGEVIEVK